MKSNQSNLIDDVSFLAFERGNDIGSLYIFNPDRENMSPCISR